MTFNDIVQKAAIAALPLLMVSVPTVANAVSFSLDDNPSAPLIGPPGPIPGTGAEAPFGAGGLAPSPSLALFPGTLGDGAILSPGPVLQQTGPNGFYVDSLSSNTNDHVTDILFSVDRFSTGLPRTDVRDQADRNQQPADIFVSHSLVPPKTLLGELGGTGFIGDLSSAGTGSKTNSLFIDEGLGTGDGPVPGGLGLLAGEPDPVSPVPFQPDITQGSHDNVDGFDLDEFDVDGDNLFDIEGYFTVYPDEAVAIGGISAADIFAVPPGDGNISPDPYAFSDSDIGLDSAGFNTDSIDALIMFDNNLLPDATPFVEPGVDYALFSLAPGSASLTAFGVPLSPADLFLTDFTGGFGRYATAEDLGLNFDDNVDALEAVPFEAETTTALIGLAGLIWYRKRKQRSV